MMGGNWGKVLKVDLTSGTTQEVEIPEKDYRDFLGGSGLAAKWFFDNECWKDEPLSPENPLMIMNGPLSGTNLPGVSRLAFCARSPLTGIWGEASMGGHFAPQLKRTGYDGIIFTGASDKPVYLYLSDEKAEIRDASHLWGKDNYETEELLREEVGDKRAQVVSIGPAGENMVKFACVMNDRGSTAGRCGMGAVMGSKKLKAVVVRGNAKVPIADEAAFKEAREKMNELLKFSLVADGLRNFGSNVHMEYGMAISDVPTKNWQVAYWDKGPGELGGTAVAESILTKNHSCYACPISCKRIVEVKSGPYAIEEGPGSEYEAAAALGTLQFMDDREANHKANELCNRYGMDVISCGSTLAYATEAFEKGLITESDTAGMKLGWNQPETLLELIRMTAMREGIGNDLADGTRAMSEKYGGKEMAIHVKGLECPMHDPRCFWAMALTYATSIRGACHCADANLYVELGVLDIREMGVKRTWPYSTKGKAAQTVAAQKKGVIANSAVICEYAWNAAGGHIGEMNMMLKSLTGFDYTFDEMLKVGDRIWYIKRALGNLMGATREEDQLPKRILEPHVEGITSSLHLAAYPQFLSLLPLQMIKSEGFIKTTGNILAKFLYPNIDKMLTSMNYLPNFSRRRKKLERGDQAERQKKTVAFDKMLQEFYQLRDIDSQGRPSRRRLEELGLKDVAEALHS
ncbi:MAG: aldehyde ferredoxin oxidoreductase family protein [Actinobacteria bacterium]|nr:aldehyde ferredoxin oxidoreductase family protein [Actinomycetota bacterium]